MTDKDRLSQVKDLLKALEEGDEQTADRILDEIAGIRESQLFIEVGRLTRQLHDAMVHFSVDSKITEIAAQEIPDAKERLRYVITMTEQAADQTLTVVEDIVPVARMLNEQATKLAENWERFLIRKMPFEEFKDMSQEITEYFNESVKSLEIMQNGLNDILMAQGFQDITGQIIRRVIAMVEDLENGMVDLIRLSSVKAASKETVMSNVELPGPVVPGVDDKKDAVATSQDDVDDLLSSLGF
ncbi:protein phosphatase CheZ [Methylotuvimicrobium alcaliphilum]|uniref:Protein phosphatase CheZ n=1 Tax=Methylotuvimicrobium alcaliphilum (strain DSM 19304 / NCIMB 14124 / VKM B-2133 / 20Z) TaxID=1091494 RepID=G4T377_META2|nr:protein phosphatase CheZ [Methylotuvimicrobium alcaliphilum]CCE24822.1 Chemotaxis phosphatase, CheZ [Methylotuvimicrobium alcaliphilum 20Z]